MKKIYLLALLFGTATALTAQSSLDLTSRAWLRKQRLVHKQETNTADKRLKLFGNEVGTAPTHALAMIKLAPGVTAEQLEAEGIRVLRCRKDFAFVSLPIDDVERVAALKNVHRLQLARPVSTKMDKARAASGVDKIHQGQALPQAYTGKGVICGIVDNGFDPNHISFRDADGNTRIGFLANITANQYTGELTEKFYGREVADNVKDIKTFTTDDNSTYHGTHTLGTMAGGYKGTSTVSTANGGTYATVAEQFNPFYGVAYDSDIAIGCGDLYDVVIAYGVDYILQYAEYEQKPVVINLSLGSNTGAHDGKGMINQFFDLCAEETNAIICVAAGNEGDKKIALNKTFSDTDTEAKTFIVGDNFDNYGYLRYGNVEIYSNDETPLDVQAVIYNKSRGRIAQRFPLTVTDTNEGYGKYWVSSSDYDQGDDIIDTQFANYFDGYVGLGWSIDTDSKRFYCTIDYYAINNELKNADGNYMLGFVVTGKDGQRADIFCDGNFSSFSNYDVAGWDDGSTDGTISDMATGNSTLVVGSYNTRENWGGLDGYIYGPGYDLPTGEISSFSSYGTLIDGRQLPHVCAPGAAIISATNSYFVNAGYADISSLNAKTEESSRNNYWEWAMGTSMATPHVTGAIALWLEADPTLTIDEVKDIVASTAIKDEAVLKANPVQVGAGKFDAYEGLKEVIRRSPTGIGNVSEQGQRMIITPNGKNCYRVFVGGAAQTEVAVYDISGKLMLHKTANGDEASIDLSGLAKGVYVLQANKSHSQRIIIR